MQENSVNLKLQVVVKNVNCGARLSGVGLSNPIGLLCVLRRVNLIFSELQFSHLHNSAYFVRLLGEG